MWVDLGSQVQKVARREGIQVIMRQWQTRIWYNMTFRDMSIGLEKTREEASKRIRVMYQQTWLTCKVGWKNKKSGNVCLKQNYLRPCEEKS